MSRFRIRFLPLTTRWHKIKIHLVVTLIYISIYRFDSDKNQNGWFQTLFLWNANFSKEKINTLKISWSFFKVLCTVRFSEHATRSNFFAQLSFFRNMKNRSTKLQRVACSSNQTVLKIFENDQIFTYQIFFVEKLLFFETKVWNEPLFIWNS